MSDFDKIVLGGLVWSLVCIAHLQYRVSKLEGKIKSAALLKESDAR